LRALTGLRHLNNGLRGVSTANQLSRIQNVLRLRQLNRLGILSRGVESPLSSQEVWDPALVGPRPAENVPAATLTIGVEAKLSSRSGRPGSAKKGPPEDALQSKEAPSSEICEDIPDGPPDDQEEEDESSKGDLLIVDDNDFDRAYKKLIDRANVIHAIREQQKGQEALKSPPNKKAGQSTDENNSQGAEAGLTIGSSGSTQGAEAEGSLLWLWVLLVIVAGVFLIARFIGWPPSRRRTQPGHGNFAQGTYCCEGCVSECHEQSTYWGGGIPVVIQELVLAGHAGVVQMTTGSARFKRAGFYCSNACLYN
jgi:hypothetical protein